MRRLETGYPLTDIYKAGQLLHHLFIMAFSITGLVKVVVVSFLLFFKEFGSCTNETLSSEAKVIRLLTSIPNYEKRVRPIKNISDPIFIRVSFYPRSLVELSDEKQRISMSAYFDLYWNDAYISWDPAEYGGVKRIVLTDQDIWKPDIIAVDSHGGIDDISYTIGTIDLVVWYDGNVTWYSNRVFIRACNLDMTYFPYDTQECYFRFESRTKNRQSLTMAVMRVDGQVESILLDELGRSIDGQWNFMKAEAAVFVEPYLDWSYYKVTFTMKRKPTYFILNILGPCIVISILIPVMFHLPPDSGEKISMGVTILLAFTVFQMVIAESLPNTSDKTPIIVIYIMGLMTTSALSIILSVLVLQLHLRGDTVMPKCLRFLAFECLARVLGMYASAQKKLKRTENAELFFANRRKSSIPNIFTPVEINGIQLEPVTGKPITDGVHLSVLTPTNGRAHSLAARKDLENVELYLAKIVDLMSRYFMFQKDLAEKKELRKQWKELARILDRLFMFVYFIINIVAAAVFFGLFADYQ
ncbi:acetylcholine receptor subunit beta-like [Lineus longissimus]|uniref:acetylcholine receptor subunit beta-like n=1 Tax=Lineus longissimus TaxID=88925 RepID=UPI002B4EC68A